VPVGRREGRETDRPHGFAAGPVESRLEALRVGQQSTRRARERATCLREQDAPALPFQQLHPGLGLEPLGLLGHGAQGVVEGGRGGADGAVELDGDE
jgi:hypothetical protein